LESTLTLEDENLTLASDTTTVYLVRSSTSESSSLDLQLDTDKPTTEVMAGEVVTLYITSASGSYGHPTTSEIVEYNDNLKISVLNWDEQPLMISKSTEDYDHATTELNIKAPAPNATTKHIEVPVKVYGECTRGVVNTAVFTLQDTSKGMTTYLDTTYPLVTADWFTRYFRLIPAAEEQVKISSLATLLTAENGDLDANPIVITSDMAVGANSLLTPESVDTADAYDNIYNNTPSYGISSDAGVAAVDTTRGATITFEDEDIGQTATVTVSIAGVGTRQLSIINIVESISAGALICTLEGPAVPAPGGEAIFKVKADGTFTPTPRDVRVSIDSANSVADSELRDLSGNIYEGATADLSLDSGSAVRLVVSMPAVGSLTIEASDISGSSSLLDTGSCTIAFAIDNEKPVATISPASGSIQPTDDIEMTVTDNVGVALSTTAYTVEKDGTDITSTLECTTSGDKTTSGTITCAKSGGGLDEGAYTVEVTPKDLAGNTGDTVTSSFTVAICTPAITIDLKSAIVSPDQTTQFTATTDCNGDVTSSAVYSWEISVQGCTGSTIEGNGVYTAGSTASCTDTVKVTDTAHGNASATATVMVCTPTVSITPSSATVKVGETQSFTASTTCDGSAVAGSYTWEVAGGTADTTSGAIIVFTAGTTTGDYEITATDSVVDATTTTTATVTVEPLASITVSPDTMLRSRWFLLPVFMTIVGDDTNFAAFSSVVTFAPAASVLPLIPLILDAQTIWELIFVMPSWLAGGAESETLTVTVTTGSEVVDDDVAIEILPFLLDEKKSLK